MARGGAASSADLKLAETNVAETNWSANGF